jgi:hypothetical protein
MVSMTAPVGAQLPVNDEPLTAKWAPSEWGPDDKVGAPNRTTPELVLKAVRLVKKGKTATLGKVYAADAPAFGTRSWKLVIPGRPTGGPFGNQQLIYNDDYVATELGQIGLSSTARPHRRHHVEGHVLLQRPLPARQGDQLNGLGPLGVEHVAQKGFVCRGAVLDARSLRGARSRCPRRTVPAIRAS